MKPELIRTIIGTVIAISIGFIYGYYYHSKQCPTPDPIIRYVQTNNQIKQIQNEIDSIDVLIRTNHVTMPRSVRDSLRKHFNP
jgi:hypothetical protein